MQANRVVATATALIGLAVAVLPVAANVHWGSDTATTLGGLALVGGAALSWLQGWQKYEARQHEAALYFTQQPESSDPAVANDQQRVTFGAATSTTPADYAVKVAQTTEPDDDPDPDPPPAGSARPAPVLDDPDYGNE